MAFLGIICLACSVAFVIAVFANMFREGMFGEKENLPHDKRGW